jgi:hypothetical protein
MNCSKTHVDFIDDRHLFSSEKNSQLFDVHGHDKRHTNSTCMPSVPCRTLIDTTNRIHSSSTSFVIRSNNQPLVNTNETIVFIIVAHEKLKNKSFQSLPIAIGNNIEFIRHDSQKTSQLSLDLPSITGDIVVKHVPNVSLPSVNVNEKENHGNIVEISYSMAHTYVIAEKTLAKIDRSIIVQHASLVYFESNSDETQAKDVIYNREKLHDIKRTLRI